MIDARSHILRSTFCPKTNGRSRATSPSRDDKRQEWSDAATHGA